MAALTEQGVRGIVKQVLADPLSYPQEMIAWLGRYTEIAGLQFSSSQVSGLYNVGTTVTALSAPTHGRTVLLRAGTTPFEFVLLTYDETYGKWVSQPRLLLQQKNDVTAWAPTTYTELTRAEFGYTWILGYKTLWDAGLRPQFNHGGQLSVDNAAGTASIRLSVYAASDADTAVESLGALGEITRTGSTTAAYRFSGWVDGSGLTAPTKNHALLDVEGKTAVGLSYYYVWTVAMRWVSA